MSSQILKEKEEGELEVGVREGGKAGGELILLNLYKILNLHKQIKINKEELLHYGEKN